MSIDMQIDAIGKIELRRTDDLCRVSWSNNSFYENNVEGGEIETFKTCKQSITKRQNSKRRYPNEKYTGNYQ